MRELGPLRHCFLFLTKTDQQRGFGTNYKQIIGGNEHRNRCNGNLSTLSDGREVNLKFCPIEKLFTAKGKGRWVIIELEVNVGDLPPVIWVLYLIHYSSITVSWSI